MDQTRKTETASLRRQLFPLDEYDYDEEEEEHEFEHNEGIRIGVTEDGDEVEFDPLEDDEEDVERS